MKERRASTYLITQLLHLVLTQRLALHELSDPPIDIIVSRHVDLRLALDAKRKEGGCRWSKGWS